MRLYRVTAARIDGKGAVEGWHEYFGTFKEARARITALRIESAKDTLLRPPVLPDKIDVPTNKALLLRWLNINARAA